MRIGILTYHFSDNFGAVLQAYALRRWLTENGHQADFVNYHPSYVESGGDLLPLWSFKNLKANIKILYLRLSAMKSRVFGNREQIKRFSDFRKMWLGVDSQSITSAEEFRDLRFPYDVYIAGSDQIWNPSGHKGLDPVYFLNFAPADALCISYAASFGKDSLPDSFNSEAGELLKKLNAISVREKSGVKIVMDIAGQEAACVPDPTLLHLEYDLLLKDSHDDRSGHIFCYALRTAKGVREVADLAANIISADIISPYNAHRRWREIGSTVYPGPAEWLHQIANAKFVVTNSFHGTVFSILFKKPFVVVGLPGEKADLNARAKNLLASLGLMNRFVEAEKWQDAEGLVDTPIDWETVSERQQALREAGESFLKTHLSAQKRLS